MSNMRLMKIGMNFFPVKENTDRPANSLSGHVCLWRGWHQDFKAIASGSALCVDVSFTAFYMPMVPVHEFVYKQARKKDIRDVPEKDLQAVFRILKDVEIR